MTEDKEQYKASEQNMENNTNKTNGQKSAADETVNSTATPVSLDTENNPPEDEFPDEPYFEDTENQSPDNELLKLQEENTELNSKITRTLAEFENFRRRNRIEIEQKLKYAAQPLCADLLSGIDNLERAINAAVTENNEVVANFVKGIEMVHKQFLDIFEKNNIQKMSPVGEPFDPNFHEAMGTVVSDEVEENSVAEVLRDGYILHDRVIRPAMVQIAVKNTES